MELWIRTASLSDAQIISEIIIAALRETNSQDYSPAIIANVEKSFSPDAVKSLIDKRDVFVAICGGEIVGTASLDGSVIRTVFVDPKQHGKGIGKALMSLLEKLAVQRGIGLLTVPSSVSAEAFYAKLGYRSVRDQFHGEERTIIMERSLT